MEPFENPFRPGAGHTPPYLAGREEEQRVFSALLDQRPIIQNLVLTGLRGVGKTVLLERLKPIAIEKKWFWASNDFSESASVDENTLAIRILTDLSALVSSFTINTNEKYFEDIPKGEPYDVLMTMYHRIPGLPSDKLKKILEVVWETVKNRGVNGIVLAYDEAQTIKDHDKEKQYPLSVLLEVVQYLQRKQVPYLLLLTGLPTLYPVLVQTRTYSERMFHIMTLNKLSHSESKEAIEIPIKNCPVVFTEYGTNQIIEYSGGYPYFIQFFCKEFFDLFLQQVNAGIEVPDINIEGLTRKLDSDFYSGRWANMTDRQRDLLRVIAKLDCADKEFTVQDIAANSILMTEISPFKSTLINNMLSKLIDLGLIYKNRHSKYSFAVPLLSNYINRLYESKEF